MAALRRVAVSEHLVLWLCIGYAVAVAPFAPGFLSTANLASILLTLIPLFVVAMGQTVVLIAGGIDLSVTSTVAVASVVGAMMMNAQHGWLAGHMLATPVAILVMLLVGARLPMVIGIGCDVLDRPPVGRSRTVNVAL